MLTTLLDRLGNFADRILLTDESGEHSAQDLQRAAARVHDLLSSRGVQPGDRVALLTAPGLQYAAGMLGTWSLGAMSVPLCPDHPPAEIAYVLDDSGAAAVLVDDAQRALIERVSDHRATVLHLDVDALTNTDPRNALLRPSRADIDSPALMLYTSGTTGRPKGVVHTHATLTAQMSSLIEAWGWTEQDRILHFLPLHHLHGLVNKLLCPLYIGARCDMLARFDARTVFERIATGEYTVIMAVPTVYAKLIDAWSNADPDTRARWSQGCRDLRVMLSGSAALPVPVLERWREISGHTLLERYGMTEIGIALSNPLHGERRPGFVGTATPGMHVRVVDDGRVVAGDGAVVQTDGAAGELEVRGSNVFVGYWNRPDETTASFTDDGWFRTGDQVVVEQGSFRIAGRLSTDIIKSGGYKISALEIESVLTAHPSIAECTVVGVPDDTWGERIGAAVVLRAGTSLDLESLRSWARNELAGYKLPTLLRVVEALPRNVMGKVLKPEARTWFLEHPSDPTTGAA